MRRGTRRALSGGECCRHAGDVRVRGVCSTSAEIVVADDGSRHLVSGPDILSWSWRFVCDDCGATVESDDFENLPAWAARAAALAQLRDGSPFYA